jgi:hypothetical protein
MAAYGDPRPFKQLIKLVARSFYAGPCPPSHYQAKDGEEGSRSKLNKVVGLVLRSFVGVQVQQLGDEQDCLQPRAD